MIQQRIIVTVGTAVVALGAALLVGGIANLAVAPAIVSAARQTLPFPGRLSDLPASFALAFLVTQNWLMMVGLQLVCSAITLTAGIGLLRRRRWARIIVEGLGWIGAAFLAVPVVWVVRWVLATPTDRMLGLKAGLQTVSSGVGQPVATVIQLFVGGPAELGWWLLLKTGMIQPATTGPSLFAWTPIGVLLGTLASIGIPVVSIVLIAALRQRRMREAFTPGES